MNLDSVLFVFTLLRNLSVVGCCVAAPLLLAILVLSERKHKVL